MKASQDSTQNKKNKRIKIKENTKYWPRQDAAPPHLEHTMSALGEKPQSQGKEKKKERKIRSTTSQKPPRDKPAGSSHKQPTAIQHGHPLIRESRK